MSAEAEGRAGPLGPPGAGAAPRGADEGVRPPVDRRQIAFITLGAVAIFVALRWLPTGTNLNHMDFRVEAKNAIEFCDPLNPQFIPVVAMRSPVTMTIATAESPAVGREVRAAVTLRTANGKAIAPEDLMVAHTRKLHLLIVDPTLADYQHVHPEPAKERGEWTVAFTPRATGVYRVFADFTPAATGRGLYASADLGVGGTEPPTANGAALTAPGVPAVASAKAGGRHPPLAFEKDGFVFALDAGVETLRAGKTIELAFTIVRPDGGVVPLEPVMGAFAHLVAFDEERSGFAHLHPAETDLTQRPDARRPRLNFKVTIPRAGRYAIWAQVNLGGREVFVPFRFEVGER